MSEGRKVDGGRIDRAIDGAVRDILDVDQPAGFRSRVMAQLPAARYRRSASSVQLPAFGFRFAAYGLAGLVLLALLLPRRAEQPHAPVTVATDTRPSDLPIVERPVATAPPPIPVAGPQTGRGVKRRVLEDRVVAAAAYEAAAPVNTSIEPLAHIDPIHVEPLIHDVIAPAAIGIRPLNTITEVQIAPLTPPDRRN